MKTHTHLKPGQNGTRRLVEKYGCASGTVHHVGTAGEIEVEIEVCRGKGEKVWRVRYGLIRGDKELEERVVS